MGGLRNCRGLPLPQFEQRSKCFVNLVGNVATKDHAPTGLIECVRISIRPQRVVGLGLSIVFLLKLDGNRGRRSTRCGAGAREDLCRRKRLGQIRPAGAVNSIRVKAADGCHGRPPIDGRIVVPRLSNPLEASTTLLEAQGDSRRTLATLAMGKNG
jgi:hypothetical protein